jgi:hypothetical protein
VVAKRGTTVEGNIHDEKYIDQIKELNSAERGGLLKGKLVGDEDAADNDQQQDETIPNQSGS